MTKQEAIEILRDTPIDIRSTREDDIHTLYATAQGMAIEALQRGLENVNADSCSEEPNRSDLISRQDAIDAMATWDWQEMYLPIHFKQLLEDLPSAQTEPLTDKEQRIFLAAMTREREVCKQVDEEWRDCREPYEDSLVSICNEIERKVKGALWTI